MKAGEAPEKIYLSEFTDITEAVFYVKQDNTKETDIEYTRTDAFIEKACEYFRRGLVDTKVIDDYRNIVVRGIQASYTSVEEFIDDFKKYMEGE